MEAQRVIPASQCIFSFVSGASAGEVEYKPLPGGPSNSPQKADKEEEVSTLCQLKSASKSSQN